MVRNCIHFGAGALGRGLVIPRLVDAGWSVCVVDPVGDLVSRLRQDGGYELQVREGGDAKGRAVAIETALHPEDARRELEDRLSTATLITTSVRKENLHSTVALLAGAWRHRMADEVAVVGCENVERIDEMLGAAFAATGLAIESRERIVVPRTVVDRVCANGWPATTAIRTEPYMELAASTAPGDLPGIDLVDGIDAVFDRKRYLVNTFADAASILGLAKGHVFLSETFRDEALLDELTPLLEALKEHLRQLHGFTRAELDLYARTSRSRLADDFIPRRLDTVARDVWRKMLPSERFFAPLIDLERRGLRHGDALSTMARLVALGSGLDGSTEVPENGLRRLASSAGDPVAAAVYGDVAHRLQN